MAINLFLSEQSFTSLIEIEKNNIDFEKQMLTRNLLGLQRKCP
jgi:hypothetical protein